MPAAAPRILPFLAALLGTFLCACAYAPAGEGTAANFPVVEPFAIDRAGSKVSVEFELPDARENGRLRPVYIGFRGIDKRGDFSDEEVKVAQGIMRYMEDAPIPVRLKVRRLGAGGREEPVVLQEKHIDMRQPTSASLRLVQGDVVTMHRATSMDNNEMIDAGRFDENKTYYIHEFVRIAPPTAGRYRLEAESLETHPILHGLRYELIVSHYYEKGIF